MSWLRIPQIDFAQLKKLPDALTLVFYAFMFFALVATLVGAPGIGFLLLIIGATGHVVRAGLEDFAAQREAEPEIAIRRVSKPRARASRPKVKAAPNAKAAPKAKATTKAAARPKAPARPREGSASTRRSVQR